MAMWLCIQGGREVTRTFQGFPGTGGEQQTLPHHVFLALPSLV